MLRRNAYLIADNIWGKGVDNGDDKSDVAIGQEKPFDQVPAFSRVVLPDELDLLVECDQKLVYV